jgi:nitric oxide reductase NorQ protein
MLVYAGTLMSKGIPPLAACSMALVQPITDDPAMLEALHNVVLSFLE